MITSEANLKANLSTPQTLNGSISVGQGKQGEQGLSAYQIWVSQGNVGKTLEDFFEYYRGYPGVMGLRGLTGPQGEQGIQGDNAYKVWLSLGNTGTEQDFINSLKTDSYTKTETNNLLYTKQGVSKSEIQLGAFAVGDWVRVLEISINAFNQGFSLSKGIFYIYKDTYVQFIDFSVANPLSATKFTTTISTSYSNQILSDWRLLMNTTTKKVYLEFKINNTLAAGSYFKAMLNEPLFYSLSYNSTLVNGTKSDNVGNVVATGVIT